MVFYEKGSHKFFDEKLLTLLLEKKNDSVRKILKKYQPTEAALVVARLRDGFQATLLHYAARYGNEEMTKYLIDSGSEVDARDDQGRTPLMLAVKQGHEMVVDVLLKAKVRDPRNLRDAGLTLRRAVESRSVELMKLLLDRGFFSVNQREDACGQTALHIAAGSNDLQMVKLLVEKYNADVNAVDEFKSTPMRTLFLKRSDVDASKRLGILRILLGRATSLTTCQFLGEMQVRDLLVFGCREAVELVLQRIDDLNVTDEKRNTVVHYLADNCNANVIETLRDRGFNVNARNTSGMTPLHCAARQLLPHVVEFFLQKGPDVRTPYYYMYESPLRVLFKHLHSRSQFDDAKKCIQLLLLYGFDPVDEHLNDAFEVVSRLYDITTVNRVGELENILMIMAPILAHLAVRKGLGVEVDESTMSEIASQPSWVEYFAMCKMQVDRMKKTTIWGNVTLFKFLTENGKKIVAYMRNEELVSELERLIEEFEKDSPYPDLLRKRLAKAMDLAELKKKAIAAICWLFNVENNAQYFAAEYIIDYLSFNDMKNVICVTELYQQAS